MSVMLMLTLTSFGQVKGVDFNTAKSKANFVRGDEKLTKFDENSYGFTYNKTPEGLKHCVEKLKSILKLNGLDFDKPNLRDNESSPSKLSGSPDYQKISLSLSNGESEIYKRWELNGNIIIALALTSDGFGISIIK